MDLGAVALAGYVDLSSATLASGTTTLPSLSLSGTLITRDNWTVTGLFSCSGNNTLQGVGSLRRLTAAGGMTVSLSFSVLDDFVLINPAGQKAVFTAAPSPTSFPTLDVRNVAVFENDGELDLNSPVAVGDNGPHGGTFTNYGLVVQNASYSQLTCALNNNYGSIVTHAGTLEVGYNPTTFVNAGSIAGDAGTEVDIYGVYTQTAAGQLSGDRVVWQGTAGTVAGTYQASATTVTQNATVAFVGSLFERIRSLTDYDQITSYGTASIPGTLQVALINGFTPQLGNQFEIIDNRVSNAANGTFTNLPEGAIAWSGPYGFTISYVGGTGNDVVLTATTVSAQQQIASIANQVNMLVTAGTLNSGNGNALTVKLNSATASLISGNTTAGVNQLNAFINQVTAFQKSGKLTSAQAQALINATNLAIAAAQGNGAHLTNDTGAGSSSTSDAQPVTAAGQLVTGTIGVYLDNADGTLVPSDEQARFDDAIASLDATFGGYGVDLIDVGTDDAADAIVQVQIAGTSAAGSAPDGVLGCTFAGQIRLLNGWNWYTGSDPTAIGANQYDFETILMHELGHAIGLGHSGDTGSVMYPYLGSGEARRGVTLQDMAVLEATGDTAPEPLLAAQPKDRTAESRLRSSVLAILNSLFEAPTPLGTSAGRFGFALQEKPTQKLETWSLQGQSTEAADTVLLGQGRRTTKAGRMNTRAVDNVLGRGGWLWDMTRDWEILAANP
jgi:hypothetical protein